MAQKRKCRADVPSEEVLDAMRKIDQSGHEWLAYRRSLQASLKDLMSIPCPTQSQLELVGQIKDTLSLLNIDEILLSQSVRAYRELFELNSGN